MKKILTIITSLLTIFMISPSCEVEKSDEEEIYQKPTVTIEAPTDSIPSEGANVSVVVNSDVDYTLVIPSIDKTWLSANTTSGTAGKTVFSITAAKNETSLDRYSRITLIDEDNYYLKSFDILQATSYKQEEPVLDVYTLSVSPLNLSFTDEGGTQTVTVAGNVNWTATCDNAAFTISPASGEGAGEITVTAAKNTGDAIDATLTISTDNTNVQTTRSFAVAIHQDAAPVAPSNKVLAEWKFNTTEKDALAVHFTENAKDPTANLPGNGGFYIAPNVSGNGMIEYYNGIDKKSINPKNRVKRAIGAYGEPVFYGTWKDDYILFTAESENDLAANTKVHIFFTMRASHAQAMRYWKIEYLDGTEWKVAKATTSKTVGEETFDYNIELPYNTGAEQVEQNVEIDQTVTLSASAKTVQFRVTCVSTAMADGSGLLESLAGNYVVRLSGEDANASTPYLKTTKSPIIEVIE